MKSNKQRRAELKAKRAAKLAAAERAAKLEALSRGVPVDRGALAPDGSYDIPDFMIRGYYVDVPFNCQACGEPQVWTAAQQKWWYEVAKGNVWTTAKLCRSCRQRERERQEASRPARRGDPNPYKNPGLLVAKIRSAIEPTLRAAGFQLAGRDKPDAWPSVFIQYARSDELFSITWDQHEARLLAELITEGEGALREIASATFSGVRSSCDIEERLAPFMASVQTYLGGLREF